jgi:hypothetical protein
VNRACPLCIHPNRGAIDAALARGASTPGLSATYDLSERIIQRHAAEHVGANEAVVVAAPRTFAGMLAAAHKVLDEAQWMASAGESVRDLVLVVRARVELMAVEFGTKNTMTVVEDPRKEWEALSHTERKERLAEMKHRLLELEAESTKGEH